MDEIKDKKTTGGESTANSGASANRERRPRNGQRGQRRQPGGSNKKTGAPAADAAGEQRAAEQSKQRTEATKQRRPDAEKKNPGAVNAAEKNDRGGKRRAPVQNRSGRKNGTDERTPRAFDDPAAARSVPGVDVVDSFADISLSGSSRPVSLVSTVSDEDDSYVPGPDDFRIPDEDILPECILPRKATAEGSHSNEGKTEVVGIRFENSGKTYYFAPGADKFVRGEHAIVETARGVEYGEISMGNTYVPNDEIVQPLRAVGRRATAEDAKHDEENHRREAETMSICAEKIAARGLEMKLVGSSYTFDNTKLIFYFTAAGRVDFRELVKDLAAVFRTRIELRQIGIRDEAKLLGGYGVCGRKLCCASFLPNFNQVSIRMAKEQGLSLSSSKISGCCGRLMCCLRFEHETYEREIKLTPPVDSIVETADGRGVVTENNPIAGTVKVRLDDKPSDPPKAYHRDTVNVISRGARRNDAHSADEGDDGDIIPEE